LHKDKENGNPVAIGRLTEWTEVLDHTHNARIEVQQKAFPKANQREKINRQLQSNEIGHMQAVSSNGHYQ